VAATNAPAAPTSGAAAPAPTSATSAPAAAATAGPAASGAKPDKLTVAVWGGAWGDAVKEAVGDPFEKEFGVKVDYVHQGDAENMAKMRAEAKAPSLDVVYWTPNAAYIIANEQKSLVPIKDKQSLIPNMGELHQGFFEPELWTEWTVAPWTYGWTLLYRTDQIPQDEAAKIDSWNVIFDPKYKGRVGWPDITWLGTAVVWLSVMQGAGGTIESGKPHESDKGWELLPKLKEQVNTFYTTDDEAVANFKTGETWITYRSTFENYVYQDEGVPNSMWTNLKEGMIITNEAMSIVKSGDAAREDLSARWIN
jgi:putative spermidine/putrescine transport system substrate-binding protein